MTEQCFVYKHFSESGDLLYIGSTRNPHKRLMEHKAKPWFPMIANVEVEAFPTREEALEAEKMAIAVESPLHNIKRFTSLLPDPEPFSMTPAAFRAARESLGLSQAQAARLLGYGAQSRISEIEGGKTDKVNETAARLMRAYLDGYRPDDWPR